MVEREPELFGSRARTSVLVSLRLMEQSYASELAAVVGTRLYSVQRILTSLEGEGVVTSRLVGRTRVVTLNPRYVAAAELSALLWKLGEHDTALQKALAQVRRRPRRAGKPGLPR